MKNRTAIITGAASGIGLAISKKFAEDGASVVMADINDKDGIKEAEKINAYFIKSDLTKQEDCKALIDKAYKKYGRIDILVNNAGIQHVAPIDEFPEEKWNFIINLMLTGPFLLTKYAWSYLKKNKWGRVININSVHGLRASEFKSAYISAKHGLMGLTKTAALEGAPYGITVNSICPAYVRTPLVENQISDQAKTHNISENEVIEKIMLKKAFIKKLIEPSEVAEIASFLCKDAASTITGTSITADCGWTAS
ncbi:MAG: 3-hydroxybutyrate dehydrogenase [Flexistipes sinusarabici]|uniref:3-hydroxybutyrate dehydrogenase n=1 Tax=Flexistipes sinusarabici TaxID=2352 RepID=A0A5D0MRB2_FLESI|nr:3-hydroxybutyrate dehydrogenase [Flexistipes sinusarabici]TYB34058.1 MAG: 3-hydroxybutyrate dehydrogenase [Flexistipes sinusarabici]